MYMSTVMYVHNHVRAQTCGHKRDWAQTWMGTNVPEHKCVWAQICLGTNVSGLRRVDTIVWAQTCIGTVEWCPNFFFSFYCVLA